MNIDKRVAYLQKWFDCYFSQNGKSGKIHGNSSLFARIVATAVFKIELYHIDSVVEHSPNKPQRLCRHKISAAISCAMMNTLPFCHKDDRSRYSYKNRKLNADIAVKLAFDVLSQWPDDEGGKISLARPALTDTYDEYARWLVRSIDEKPVALDYAEYFPFFPVSQFWSAVEIACRPAVA